VNSRRYGTLLCVVAFSLLSMFSVLTVVSANVPSVLQIDNVSQGSSGKVRLQISHLNPSPNHYVDVVEVDVNGQVTQFNLQPQSSNTFTTELDIGQLQGTPNVRARDELRHPDETRSGYSHGSGVCGSLVRAS